MYFSVHPPSPYIVRHQQRLLPDWDCAVLSMLVVLQPCSCNLFERSAIAERQKHQLRQNFLAMARQIASHLQVLGYATAVFDPRTGLPCDTRPGLILDDVAVARSCLGYGTVESHGCLMLLHPQWGSSVYPATVLTAAAPAVLAEICQQYHLEQTIPAQQHPALRANPALRELSGMRFNAAPLAANRC